MNSIILITSVAMALTCSTPLTAEQEAAIRTGVYAHTPRLYSPHQDFNSEVELPRQLERLYLSHPTETLNILLKIVDGASPNEAITAITYAYELIDGPGAGVVCILACKADNFDKVHKTWGTTARRHWLAKLQDKVKPK